MFESTNECVDQYSQIKVDPILDGLDGKTVTLVPLIIAFTTVALIALADFLYRLNKRCR